MSSKRVVITGVGMITSLGMTASENWSRVLAGQSGVKNITSFDTEKLACKIASEISDFNAENYISPSDIRKMDRFIHLGIAATVEAITDSNILPQTEYERDRTGVIVGSGIGGLGTIEKTSINFYNSKTGKVNPYFIPASLVNLLSGHISIRYGFCGPNSAVATACSTGAHAIGDASRIIKYGDADIMIAGGAEAPITPTGIAGFIAVKALATGFNNNPTEASRPWDKNHDGFVIGEGAGILVLEEYEHAKARKAKIYAEVVGYGLTSDAYHITVPNGRGAYRAMENALKDVKVTPEEIDYINAHGTSTKIGDEIELNAVQNLFTDNKKLSMSSTKSSIGHLLGAAGSVEAIFTAFAIRDQIVPPTINLYNPIKDVKIDLVPLKAKKKEILYALTNSFGFGGINASLLLKRIDTI